MYKRQILNRLLTSGDYNYLSGTSTTTATLTLKKSSSGADSIDYLQLRDNSNAVKFKISGDGILFTSDVLASHEGDTNTKIRFPADDTISMETAGSERFRISSGGETKFTVGTNKTAKFYAASHNDETNLGAGLGFSRVSDGAEMLTGIFSHSNTGLGIAARDHVTILTGGSSNVSDTEERVRIDSGGRFLINTTTEGHGNADDLTIATAASGSLGHTGITIRSGTSSDGNIFFSDATSGSGETIGGIKYKHGGAGSNPETLNFIANGLTRATIGATYFYVDDGTNARLKIQPDSATLNMIVSTTTNNGSYCDLSYQAANHIFKYGGNERGRLSTDGDFTITGELAPAQDYPNFRPTLDLNFAAVKKLDSRITFYRSTVGSYIDEDGDYRWASINEPRFNHDETTFESKGLLIEPARTNKLSSGNNIPSGSNSGGGPGPSLVANNVEAPDGSFTARTVDFSNASGNMNSANIEFSGWDSDPSGQTYSASIWVKGTAGHTINLYLDASGQGSSDTGKGNFTLTGKWQRLSVYHTYPSGSNSAYLRCGTRNLQTGVEGTATVVSFWGTTIVEESQPGSTIATPIVPVTTAPDYALIDGEDFTKFFNEAEGTIITSTDTLDPAGVRRPAVIEGDVTNNDRHYIQEAGAYQYQIRDGGSTQAQIDAGAVSIPKNIIAAAYKLNDVAVSINGSNAATDTSATMPTCTKLKLGEWSGTFYFGHISRFTYYSRRVTNSQLKTLSST